MSDSVSYQNNKAFKTRRSTTFTVTFPTMPSLQRTPRKVELHQSQYKHDILILSFPVVGELWFDEIPTGLPIEFSWEHAGDAAVWYGYVSSISKTVIASQRERTMQVHCIGSSFPLKERVTRVFSDVTIPEVAEKIAKEHGLSFVGDQHPRRFSQLTLAGHSYWEWLQEQAKRIGFVLIMNGTTLHFRKIDSYLNQTSTSVPILYAGDTPSLYRGQLQDRTLDSFEVIKGDFIEQGPIRRTEKLVGGVDPMTGKAYTAQSSPKETGEPLRQDVSDVLFTEYRSDQVAGTYRDSKQMSEGAAQMARFKLPAKVKCQGDPRIHPYGLVRVLGTGAQTDGFWLVQDVVHIFQKFGDYNITMTVLSDGTGNNQVTAFRGTEDPYMSTLNIAEMVSRPTTLTTLAAGTKTQLTQLSPSIFPGKQGFKKTQARWRSTR